MERLSKFEVASLVNKAKKGDKGAWDVIYNLYRWMALSLVRKQKVPPSDEEDIVQDSWKRAFTHLSKLRDPGNFGSWLGSIVISSVRQNWRKNNRKSRVTGKPCKKVVFYDPTIFNEEIDDSPSCLDSMMTKERHVKLRRCIETLSQIEKKALIGYYFEGGNSKLMAKELGVPHSTVKTRMFRGKRKLAQICY